jgi:hypothetical protein
MRLDAVRPLLEREGPFVTVHLDVSRNTEDARQQLDARLSNVRRELEEAGVPADVVDRLEERLREQTHLPGQVRRTVVACGGDVVLDDVRAGDSSWPEGTSVGPLPDLAGYVAMADGEVPFVVALVDREGAEVEAYVAPGGPPAAQDEVQGDVVHIRKLSVGDWMEDKVQQAAENAWARNAELVAERVRELAREHVAKLVFVAGDVRAVGEVAGLLEGEHLDVRPLEHGSRAPGAAMDPMWQEIRASLGADEAHADVDTVQELERGAARGTGVARGLDQVLDSLVRGEVDRLVLDLQAARELSVTPKEHPGLALPPAALEADSLPADQVLVAAAAATSAAVSTLPRELFHDEVAALLRWEQG